MAVLFTSFTAPTYDEDSPNFDGFQGFQLNTGGVGAVWSHTAALAVTGAKLRLGKVNSGTDTVYVELWKPGPWDGGTKLATSNSVSTDLINSISGLADGANLDSTNPLIEFTFPSAVNTVALDSYGLVLRRSTSSTTPVPSWRDREGATSVSSGYVYLFSGWSEQTHLAYEFQLLGADPVTTLYIRDRGFRFPYPRWNAE